MTRTVSAGMATMLATRSHTLATMLQLELRDGTLIGVTDHDANLSYDIGDGVLSYDASTGIFPSDISLSASLDADNYEVRGPIRSEGPVTLEAVLGGRFNRARAKLFKVDWKQLANGDLKLIAGSVANAKVEGGEFVFEVRDDFDRYNQSVGRLMTNNCDADYADGIRCNATPTEVVGTVTAVTDAMRFTVSYAGSFADDFFNKGTVAFLTGDLAGTLPIEIEDWTVAGAITLFAPAVEAPATGDTLTVRDGCGKSRADCMAHDNILEFRGYPEVPGSDQVLRMPIPGQGND